LSAVNTAAEARRAAPMSPRVADAPGRHELISGKAVSKRSSLD
jgi:hypothetical protein